MKTEIYKDEGYRFMGAAFEVYNAQQPVGYLVNFGHKGTLEWKRFILSELIVAPPKNANPL